MPAPDRQAVCPCGSGRRYKSCCYGADRSRAASVAAAGVSHRIVDGVLQVLLPLVESRGEYRIACGAGCNACCTQFIMTSRAEARRIAAWLLEPDQAELLRRFETGLDAWRAAIGPEVAALEGWLAEHHGPPHPNAAAAIPYEAAGVVYHRRGLMCLFNLPDGRCGIYPVRPLPCRATYVLDSADHCPPDRGAPRVLKHPSLQGAIADARQIIAKAARRGGDLEEGALAGRVAEALAEARATGHRKDDLSPVR